METFIGWHKFCVKLHMDFKSLPKIELHLHLDCSLSYEVVSQLEPSVTRAEYEASYIAPAKCYNLAEYLTYAIASIRLMQTKEQLKLVTKDLFRQLKEDQVIYAEMRFAPLQHLDQGLQPEEVVRAVDEAVEEGIKETGIEVRVILCTLRHYSEAQSLQTVKLVEQFKGTRVVGLDIAADEAGYPIDNHISAFQYAATKDLHCTAHAGEARGADSVWETLEHFGPSRIGHGVRSHEDEKLVAHLKEKGIHLECCPTSNVQINVFDTYPDHPIDQFYQKGLSVSVNTDGRTLSNVALLNEYQVLHQHFNWTKDHFLQCNLNAVNAAFIPEVLKAKLRKQLEEAYAK